MSSDEARKGRRALRFDEAVRFLTTVCEPGNCPICNTKSWQLPMLSAESPVSVVQSGLTLGDEPDLELKMFCTNCGFLRSHSLSFIFDWLDKNPGEPDAENE
ncbi:MULTISPECIES: hypothetical protein [Pseudomonas]|uniref:hypothetical protein n=1 Tax=Pseudomonas TaxID=286 RepID=UPI0012D83CE6|nr:MULTISPECIES: hypothetical protein [Pseudomonas]MCE0999984.1 hypothetical protein [Pseudomonas sp. NMI1173_11]GLO24412.1 hypothetical protein PPUJ21368_22400 [Pseudomonas putida]HDS0969199.1 hypothetical protein [Pseudomonas putida]